MRFSEFAPDYIAQIPKLNWHPINRNTWEAIQDEGLDEEQEAYDAKNWVMASLEIKPQDRQGLQQFNPDTVEEFNRFDIALKELYPGLVDLIDYDAGTITIVKTL
jgi:hypothetical protein